MVDRDRPRGILSKSDRRVLVGESDIEPKSQQERNARARIRERIGAGLRDFELLADPVYLEDRDLESVRGPADTHTETETGGLGADTEIPDPIQNNDPAVDPEISDALIEMVAFAFRVKPVPSYIERIFEAGLRRGLNRLQPEAELSDVQITIEDPVTLADRLEAYIDAGWSLSEWEVIYALKNDLRSGEEIAENVRNNGIRGDEWTPGDRHHQMPMPEQCPECEGNINEEGVCTDCGRKVQNS